MNLTRKILLSSILICSQLAYPSATFTIDSLLQTLQTTLNGKSRIVILQRLSEELEDSSINLSMQYAEQALTLAMASEDEQQKVVCLFRMSQLYYAGSDLKNAMEFAQNAKTIAEKNHLEKELARVLNFMGMIYYDIGDKKRCPEYCFASLKISEKLNDKLEVCRSLSTISLLYRDQNDNRQALAYLGMALSLAKEVGDKAGISSILNNIASVYSNMNDFTRSLNYLEEALKLSRELQYPIFEANNYLNIGRNYFIQKDYGRAAYYNYQALNTLEKTGNKRMIATCHLNLGKIKLEMGRPDESRTEALNALEIGINEGYKEIIYRGNNLLTLVSLARRDTIGAFKYLREENRWKDSLDLTEKEKNLASLALRYQFEKREQQEMTERQRKKIVYIAAMAVLTLGLIVILLIMNQLRLKAKKSRLENDLLEKELGFKKKELTLQVMSLMKRNEILSGVYQKISEIEKEAVTDDMRMVLKKVMKDLHGNTAKENMAEFILRFKEVHESFYEALIAKYPELTPSELKLCAFLKLNLSTKEISELTGQRLNTLEMARYRLRQKLGITNSEVNLVTFLSQI